MADAEAQATQESTVEPSSETKDDSPDLLQQELAKIYFIIVR